MMKRCHRVIFYANKTMLIKIASALGVLTAALPQAAHAIDCQKATGDVEQAICRDPDVLGLDRQLALALARAVENHPGERARILADERSWIARRNKSCKPFAQDAPQMHRCLEDSINTQLDVLARLNRLDASIDAAEPAPESEAPSDSPDLAVCETLLTRYRPLAGKNPGVDPLNALARTDAAGFKPAPPGRNVFDANTELATWARQQQPSVALSKELSDAVNGTSPGGDLQQAPGLPYFMLARSEGSAHCDASVFFSIKNRVASLEATPLAEPDGWCPQSGQFFSLDSKPLFVRQAYDYSSGLQASVEVATWRGQGFSRACKIDLTYLPAVNVETLNDHKDDCSVSYCEPLRRAALDLVKLKIFRSLSIPAKEEELTPSQQDRYQKAVAALGDDVDPDAGEHVAYFPYAFRDDVFVVRIADFTIGWRDFADQSVKFRRLESERLSEVASFAVGVWKGELKEASVSP